jgi:hypothetical protein
LEVSWISRDATFEALNRVGTVVLQARPVHANGQWIVEVDVAHTDAQLDGLTIDGVPIVVRVGAHVRRSERRLRGAPHPSLV